MQFELVSARMNSAKHWPEPPLENPVPYLTGDAQRVLEAARVAEREGRIRDEASFSRIAVLLYFTALRSLVNVLYEWSKTPDHEWRQLSVHHRWTSAVQLCLPRLEEPGEALQFPRDHVGEDLPLLERFLELRDAVNDLDHHDVPCGVTLVDATEPPDAKVATGGDVHPRTGFPRRQSEYRRAHAEAAATIYEDMVTRLDLCFRDKTRVLTRTGLRTTSS
ncbi:MAG: hypothetical protein A3J29_23130 [Acidobacteria bacterium RIFCSPLOWO2_12_FULL_67_14b]|nr:MAG: hypothetical protein A3I61_13465 [Acidobacteria bacterium RIFCSPLOWO2_02_FULL_68_18]OFW45403.1 MAG: hypothetical protein A3J29_23130 [Acidobacteria bacterium RIFCSPLOWO2_12_FULL_67_14b]